MGKRKRFAFKHGAKYQAGDFEIECVKDQERRGWLKIRGPKKSPPREKKRKGA